MQPVGGGGGLIGQHDPRTRPHPSPARRRLPRLLSTAVAGLPAGRPQLQSRWLWEGCGGTLQPGISHDVLCSKQGDNIQP